MSNKISYKQVKFPNAREARKFASLVGGYIEGPFFDDCLNTEYIVFYVEARAELANGVIKNCINWIWLLYDSEETAHKVKKACETVSPSSRFDDIMEVKYKGIKAYAFRIHK